MAATSPSATVSFSPAKPLVGETVTFTASVTAGSAPIAWQAWDLSGDGDYGDSTGLTATRTFDAPGTYTVHFVVVDRAGRFDIETKTVEVFQPPVASFTFAPAKPGSGRTTTFTSTSTAAPGLTIASEKWDFNGAGTYGDASGATATNTFATPGSYTVGLRVTDSRGITATVRRTVVVYAPPTAAFDFAPVAPVPGQQVTFTSSSTDLDGQIAGQAWAVDGGGFVAGPPALTRSFAAGTHTVSLQVTDSQGLATVVSRTFDVVPPPTASFTFSPAKPGSGSPVTFTSTAVAAPGATLASQAWDLNGDGNYADATGPTASKAFAAPGSYVVGLRVVDSRGIEATLRRTVVVYAPPVASFDVSPGLPNADQEITFTSTSTDPDGQVKAQAWDVDGSGFADGSGPVLKRTLAAGRHTVRLRVTDSQGLSSVAERDVVVAPRPIVSGPAEHPPTAAISYFPAQPRVGGLVALSAGAADPDGDALRAEWDLNGDGVFGDATGLAVTRTFDTPGPHPVAVRVTDAGGASTVAFETVTVLPGPSITPPGVLQWISPFPIVRIAGSAERSLTRIRVLSVLTPAGTRVTASCSGRGCPRRPIVRLVGAGRPTALLRLSALERRWPAGTRIEISVTRTGFVGKFTRLVLQRLKPPTRVDRCVVPGHATPINCPEQP